MSSTIRDLVDEQGLRWTVRRFLPTFGAARGAAVGPTPRSEAEVPGWLTFECEPTGWLRRLAPAPADWESCDEATLRRYFEAARHMPRRNRDPLP